MERFDLSAPPQQPLMGGITSLPEIANSITSSLIGNPALAVNNLLGSAAINVLLLAIADAIIGRDALTSVVAKPGTLMQSTLCMLVLMQVAVAILIGDVLILERDPLSLIQPER